MEQTLGKRIAANRKLLGLTQDQLAEKLGVTAQAVSKWENDQSCPDISILPELSKIFRVSTDTLLGCSTEVREYIENDTEQSEGVPTAKGNWTLTWDNSRKDTICFAVMALAVGVLYLLSIILKWNLSFWDILWPTALLVFGLFGLFPTFSVFRLGCVLVGSYFLADKFFLLPFGIDLSAGVILALIVVLFGIHLLVDGLRKSRKPGFQVTCTDKNGKSHHGKTTNNYEVGEASFCYNASFSEAVQPVSLDILRSGDVSTSFGEYTVDLTGVASVGTDCKISASCSFGELTLLIPRQYTVKPQSSTAFASFTVEGQPDTTPVGQILLEASVNFGEIKVKYI